MQRGHADQCTSQSTRYDPGHLQRHLFSFGTVMLPQIVCKVRRVEISGVSLKLACGTLNIGPNSPTAILYYLDINGTQTSTLSIQRYDSGQAPHHGNERALKKRFMPYQ